MGQLDARILVVDDELFFREAIVDVLDGEGWSSITCEDGESALEALGDVTIGVAILDVRLPGIDGIELLRRICSTRPEMRVIMLSGSTDQELVLEALRLGASDYLAKPLHDEELALAVKRALQSHSMASSWDQLRTRLERLVEAVHDLNQRAAAREGEDRLELLRQGAVEAASEILEAGRASIMLLNEEGTELEVVAAVGCDMEPLDMDTVAVGTGIAGLALENREPVLVDDMEADERFGGSGVSGRYESNSFALAPLESGLQGFGVLCVTERFGGQGFTDEDLSLLRLLAMQVSELLAYEAPVSDDAVEESQGDEGDLFREDDSSTRVFDGSALPDGVDDAELARLVCEAVVSEVEPRRLIDAVLRPLCDALGAAPVSIFLLDGASGGLSLEGECDGGVRSERSKLEPGRGLTGLVVQTGNLIAAPDPSADTRFDRETDTPEDGECAPMLCVPLRLRGKVFGVFRAFFPLGHEPSARTGEVLAAALSAAGRNVLLYRSLVDSIAEVAEARRVARGS